MAAFADAVGIAADVRAGRIRATDVVRRALGRIRDKRHWLKRLVY